MGSLVFRLAVASAVCWSVCALGPLDSGLVGSKLVSNPASAAGSVASGGNVSVLSMGSKGSSLINISGNSNLPGEISAVNIGTDSNGLHVGLLDIGKVPTAGGSSHDGNFSAAPNSASGSASSIPASPTGNSPWIRTKQAANDYDYRITSSLQFNDNKCDAKLPYLCAFA